MPTTVTVPAPTSRKTCAERTKRPFTILFVTLSSVLGLTVSVLYWNYTENIQRISTKKYGVILDHWGKGGMSRSEKAMIDDSILMERHPSNDLLKPTKAPIDDQWSKREKERFPDGFFRSVVVSDELMSCDSSAKEKECDPSSDNKLLLLGQTCQEMERGQKSGDVVESKERSYFLHQCKIHQDPEGDTIMIYTTH